jgi:hypothetical protein
LRARVRADQYNYDFCGVVEEKSHPTWLLFQTILDARLMREYACVFKWFTTALRAASCGYGFTRRFGSINMHSEITVPLETP